MVGAPPRRPSGGRRSSTAGDPDVSVGSLPLLCLWLFLDGATFSVFTTPLLLLAAPRFVPWQVATAGGAASAAGAVLQLLALRWMLAHERPWMSRFVPARESLERARARYPSASFLAIAIARATPLPDAPVKLVAAATGYPSGLYFLAVLLGALPYYFALAWIGHAYRFPLWAVGAVAALFVLGLLVDRLRRGRGRAEP
jgi:uncharacterized membrane protein YdjX (TVP38/TMEM64 family)